MLILIPGYPYFCPKCSSAEFVTVGLTFSCSKCKIEWTYDKTKPCLEEVYEVPYHDIGVSNVSYVTKFITTRHNFADSLGDTFSEKNESLYIRMMELCSQLGNKIENFFCSIDWWKDFWKHCSFIVNDGTLKETPKGLEAGVVHGNKRVYISLAQSTSKYWVAVECSQGIGWIDIEGVE